MIKITFPDGNIKEFESGVTTFEIAKSISPSLAKKTLAGKVNGKLIDGHVQSMKIAILKL